MKRTLGILLVLMLITSALGVAAAADENSSRIVPEGQTLTLTIWMTWDPGKAITMNSFNDMPTWDLVEQETGIRPQFIHPTQGNVEEQLNLMLISGDLPDIIYYNWPAYPGGPEKAIADGTVIRLNDLIDQYAPNYKAMLEEFPGNAQMSMTDDGTYYGFANFCMDTRDPQAPGYIPAFQTFGWLIRSDWLENVGIDKLPETVDEWEVALTAFKNDDPNGNGIADEIPLVCNSLGEVQNWMRAWGITGDFYISDVENQKVSYGFYSPEYKEALTMLKRWYDNGLLDPDFAASDGKQKDAKITSNVAGAWTGSTSGGFGRYITMMKPQNPDLKMTGTVPPHVVGGESFKFDGWSKFAMGRQGAITTSCKNPVEAAKFCDYFYGPKGHMYMNYGVEDITYQVVDGVPMFTDFVAKNPDGLSVDQALIQYALSAEDFFFLMEPQLWLNRMSLPEQREMLPRWATGSKERIMPPVLPSSEEAAEMSAILGEVNTYATEMFTKFVMGVEPLDNFETYLANMKSLGVERAIELKQSQLDRYNARIGD